MDQRTETNRQMDDQIEQDLAIGNILQIRVLRFDELGRDHTVNSIGKISTKVGNLSHINEKLAI